MSVVLDTHAVIWYLAGDARLSNNALQTIRERFAAGARCLVLSICLVEATYLMEKNRLSRAAFGQLREALA